MTTTLRNVMVVAASLTLVNCAALNAARSGNVAGAAQAAAAEAAALAQKVADSKAKADVDCKPLEERVIAWPEEKSMGGAIAVGFAAGADKGLYIDITNKDPKALKATVDGAKGKRDAVKLTATEKNDLNMYIQTVGDYVASASSRPGISWTFGVIEDEKANAVSAPAGYVLLTTGLLALMENEAQLAGVLGHEIAHITEKHAINTYKSGKIGACKVALTGQYVIEAGASAAPGGEELVKNAKFGKTMKAFAAPGGVDLDDPNNKDVDVDFIVWFTKRIMDFQQLTGNPKEDEYAADAIAFDLMASAGYDTAEYDKLIEKIPGSWALFAHHPSNSDRIEALKKLRETNFGGAGGKAPAFPANVKWPAKPAS